MPSPERPAVPISLFYSYSHKDEDLRDRLETHLSLLQTQGVIRGWHDRRIEPGTEWDGAISQNLEDAGIILLLVSADFLASRYCYGVEVARAIARHETGTARVIPVIVRPVHGWESALFGKLQALPKGGKPVTTWKSRDKAFADVARGVREAAMSLGAEAGEGGEMAPQAKSTTDTQDMVDSLPVDDSSLIDMSNAGGVAVAVGTEKVPVELTINQSLDRFTQEQERNLLSAIKNLLNISGEIKIIGKWRGSVKLKLELSPEQAERLTWAVKAGKLARHNVVDAKILTTKEEVRELSTSIFIGYSYKDAMLRHGLDTHLANLKRQKIVRSWHDRRITAGTEWLKEIDEHLESARIILWLISADFIASDYCYGFEMKRALERHEEGTARVIPVLLRPVNWQGAPFAKLQVLPRNARPVTTWRSRDAAFLDVVHGIRAAIDEMTSRSWVAAAVSDALGRGKIIFELVIKTTDSTEPPEEGFQRRVIQKIREEFPGVEVVESRKGSILTGFDLRLMSSLNDVSGIPTEGKNLIIVAAVDNVLHFRIFDGDGKVVVDTDEKRLTEQARQIEDLRKQLESLWPPHELTRSDKDRVITAVTSIFDHTLLTLRLAKQEGERLSELLQVQGHRILSSTIE